MRSEFETLEQYQDSMKKFNENTRIGFENFIQSHGSERNKLQLRCTPYTDKKGGYGSFDLDFGLSVYQHQQSKVDELQKRVDLAILGINGVMRWIDEDAIDDADFIRGGVLSALRRLEQALKGGGE
ncbi:MULTISPECIES: hypothetical protein [Acinetobacter]|uniref:Uncharacterized protein n=1 Tax=Acinetobacter junii TaxID=40215 RepID=A0A365PM72_ACIJU|nr:MULTISPECIES: hypothetical protein [Acinetobacter]RBA42347.1 hypothetical protein DDF86_00340 [Acinetobacter junii]RBA42917.1 hypothetical protein DDG62_01585 [Acinetobacter junii]RBA49822.1 hypothetical protein DC346_01965 [Acinetobacter junii]WLF73461.1 hypothetical protein Q4617_05480 [Acinetobacter junii]